jgi:hypothetical protein
MDARGGGSIMPVKAKCDVPRGVWSSIITIFQSSTRDSCSGILSTAVMVTRRSNLAGVLPRSDFWLRRPPPRREGRREDFVDPQVRTCYPRGQTVSTLLYRAMEGIGAISTCKHHHPRLQWRDCGRNSSIHQTAPIRPKRPDLPVSVPRETTHVIRHRTSARAAPRVWLSEGSHWNEGDSLVRGSGRFPMNTAVGLATKLGCRPWSVDGKAERDGRDTRPVM